MSIRSLVVGLAIGAAAVGAGSVALGAIPDSSGVVHACYQVTSTPKSGYPVKLLDTAKAASCPAGWTAAHWNQTGPKGATGARGPKGTTGAPGPAGTSVVASHTSGALDIPYGSNVSGGTVTWTQHAGEIDEVMVSVTLPESEIDGCGGSSTFAQGEIDQTGNGIEGEIAGPWYISCHQSAEPDVTTDVLPLAAGDGLDSVMIPAPPSDSTQTVGVSLTAATQAGFSVSSVRIDVIGIG